MERKYNIVLFDGFCNLCNGFVQFIIKRDREKKFIFASIQSTKGQSLLKQYCLQTDYLDTIVYIKGHTFTIKSSAVLNVLKNLDGVWKLFFVLIIIPKFFRDFVYKIISKKRYKLFGRSDNCMVPSPDIKNRFLE
ncbi:MAG: thiol-disulfide oxidoreductase DCC family protein [FCB group bacterium]|jgi:predicted DCC family thiol-disulfide oxidoreductase YuxK